MKNRVDSDSSVESRVKLKSVVELSELVHYSSKEVIVESLVVMNYN